MCIRDRQKTSIGVVFTIASSSNVLVALLFDVILNSVRHSNLVLLGAFLVLSGILLMNIKSFTSHEKQRIIGVLGGIVAGSMWGIAVFFNDRALIEGSVLNGTLIRAIISIITLSLASYIFRQKIERIIEKIQFIKNWILDYVNSMPKRADSIVIGISGGIDSSVSSTLCAMTGIKTIVLSMPIKQKSSQHDLSLAHQNWLTKKFKNVEGHTVDLDNLF